jgi:hypothetical protein
MKTLTNSGDFTGNRKAPPLNKTGGNSKRIVKLNSAFEKPTFPRPSKNLFIS